MDKLKELLPLLKEHGLRLTSYSDSEFRLEFAVEAPISEGDFAVDFSALQMTGFDTEGEPN